MSYRFEIITGPIYSGKTEELLKRLKRIIISQKNVVLFLPLLKNQYEKDYIESQSGLWIEAKSIASANDILKIIENQKIDAIAIDDLHLFDKDIIKVILRLISQGKKVIGAGLDLDFKCEPFGFMPELLALADKVDKLTAICRICHSEYAVRTQRLINGLPAKKNTPSVIDTRFKETFEPRCLNCYNLPDDDIINPKKCNLKLITFSHN